MRTLIADDQPDVVEALRLLLKREGFEIDAVHSPAAVLDSVRARDYDVLLMDLNYARDTTSGQEGLDLLARLRELDRSLPVVVMTAWGSVPLAVETLRRGARDFVLKPWENGELLGKLRSEAERGRVERHERWLAEQEWAQAREVEQGLLPREIPQPPGVRIAASRRAAAEIGGDFFDVQDLGGGRYALCIADGIGQGVSAALLMANLQAAERALAGAEPADVCRRLNALLCRNLTDGRFVTLFYAVLDAPRRELLYANAGHCPPLAVRPSGEVERLGEGGLVLGIRPDAGYRQGRLALAPGDRLVLYTDGVTEAENRRREEFGEGRLSAALAKHRGLDAEALRDRLLAEMLQFAGQRTEDDRTLITVAVQWT